MENVTAAGGIGRADRMESDAEGEGLPELVRECRPSGYQLCSLEGVHTCKAEIVTNGRIKAGQGPSLHFHSLKGRFGFGIREVADFLAPG